MTRFQFFATVPLSLFLYVAGFAAAGSACSPEPHTTWWSAADKTVPHLTWVGRDTILKAVASCLAAGEEFEYQWNFGDGGETKWERVQNRLVLEARHKYEEGSANKPLKATILLRRKGTSQTASDSFTLRIVEKTLPSEVRCAIDDGLWYLHSTQRRVVENGVEIGDWLHAEGKAASLVAGVTAANLSAFETNGFVATGNPNNPYTETVALGLRRVFGKLIYMPIPATQTNGVGKFTVDSNGNGQGISVDQDNALYQNGMFIETLVATGTPKAKVADAKPPKDGKPDMNGKTYADVVQDMVDYYAYCQYDGPGGGGWRYSCNQTPDNSASRWAALGLLSATHSKDWDLKVPQSVLEWSKVWLLNSQGPNGVYGYENQNVAWGPFASTPSGMLQLAMVGIGRGNPQWDKAETFIRDNFNNGGSATGSIKRYYYGLFALVKAMLLHDPDGKGAFRPLWDLRSTTPDTPAIDWYWAESAHGDPTDGVARTIVNDQNAFGYWTANDFDARQYAFETAEAILMLNRTLLNPGAPVGVVEGRGNSHLTAAASYHQNPARKIVKYVWSAEGKDLSNSVDLALKSVRGQKAVQLTVTDDLGTYATTSFALAAGTGR